MSAATPAETFADRAPLLNPETVAKAVRFDLFAPEVHEHVERVYVYGSFVNPDTELDRNGDTSDLDVYVTVAPEVLPRVDGEPREVSTRFGASQHGLLCRCATQGALDVYGRADPFDLSLPEASEPLRESIKRAERAVFHATERDTELLRFRATDLTLGTAAAFEAFLGDDPRLQVWPLDE
jgi:hypothetical protein